MKLPVMIFVVFCTTVLMAFEDLGPIKTVQKKYPQIFKTGSVNIITINKIPCYVFSGDAEQAFSGDFAETESELYEEATISAKSNFYEFLSKKDKNVSKIIELIFRILTPFRYHKRENRIRQSSDYTHWHKVVEKH